MKIKQNDIHLQLNTKEAYAVIALIRSWLERIGQNEVPEKYQLHDHYLTLKKIVDKWNEA